VLGTILRLYKNYKPLQFFSAIAAILTVVSAWMFIPVFIKYLHIRLIYNVPKVVVCGFIEVAALLAFFAGLILSTIVEKDRRDFEMTLVRIQERFVDIQNEQHR
jgi:hypothetical protein